MKCYRFCLIHTHCMGCKEVERKKVKKNYCNFLDHGRRPTALFWSVEDHNSAVCSYREGIISKVNVTKCALFNSHIFNSHKTHISHFVYIFKT